MEESITYQEILKKGEARGELRGVARGEARGKQLGEACGKQLGEACGKQLGEARGRLAEACDFLILVGTKRFGAPKAAVRRRLRAIDELNPNYSLMMTKKASVIV